MKHVDGISPKTLNALREGDHEAFSEIYLHYWDSLHNFLTILVGSREDAREIAQDVFMVLWDQRKRIDPSKNIKNYIYTIARNTAFHHFEHRKVFEKYARVTQGYADEVIPSDEIIIAKELRLLTDIAVAQMPELRRNVFILSKDQGLSIEEISRKLDISREAVSSHLYQARKELKEIIVLFFTAMFIII